MVELHKLPMMTQNDSVEFQREDRRVSFKRKRVGTTLVERDQWKREFCSNLGGFPSFG